MELQTTEQTVTAAAAPRRARRRLAGAVGIAALIGLTLSGSTALAASGSPSPAPIAAGIVTVAGSAATGAAAGDLEKFEATFTKYRTCMKEHGVDMPEPVLLQGSESGATGQVVVGAGTMVVGAVVPAADAAPVSAADAASFEAADKACAPIMEAAGILQATAVDSGSAPVSGQFEAGVGTIVVGGATAIGGAVSGVPVGPAGK